LKNKGNYPLFIWRIKKMVKKGKGWKEIVSIKERDGDIAFNWKCDEYRALGLLNMMTIQVKKGIDKDIKER